MIIVNGLIRQNHAKLGWKITSCNYKLCFKRANINSNIHLYVLQCMLILILIIAYNYMNFNLYIFIHK